MKLKAFCYKWWARLTGGRAVYIKHRAFGYLHVKLAYRKWDPFEDAHEEIWQIHHNLEYRELDMCTGNLKSEATYQWRYVDEGMHVAQQLQQKT